MTHFPRRGVGGSLASLLLISLSAPAQPQNTSTNGQEPVAEITVTATKIERPLSHVPSAASVVGETDLQFARQQLGLDEALTRVPGMFMQNRYNFAQDLRISIRGFGARAQFGIRGIKVLVDGIPETLPDGQGAVDSLDLGAMKEVQVLRGPSSSIYGNAAGGVISVTSEGGTKEPYAEVRYEGGEFNFEKYQLKTGGETERLNYLVSVSGQELDGYRQQSGAQNKLLTGRFDVDLGHNRDLLAVVSYTDQPRSDDPGGVTFAQMTANPRAAFPANVAFHAGEELDQTRVGFQYTAPLGQDGAFRARNYYAWRDFQNQLPVPGGIVKIDRTFAGAGFDYHYDGFWLDRPNHLVVGMDFDDQDDYRTRYANLLGVPGAKSFDQREHVEAAGLFMQDELSLSKKMRLTLGARTDRVNFDVTDHFLVDGNDSGELTFDHTSPMVGMNLDLSASTVLYATYSTSFETPTTTELNKPDTSGGFNPNLKPQIATNYEVGLRGRIGAKSRYEVALFTIGVEDELIPFEVPGAPGRNYYQNAGQSKRNGLELSWTVSPTAALRATLSYTYAEYTFSQFVDSAGNNYAGKVIPGTSQNVLFAELTYHNPHGWFAGLDATYNDGQYGDNANTTKIAGYTIANLRLGYETDSGNLHFSPFVGIYNLTNEVYTQNVRLNPVGGRYYEGGPWRNAFAGITARWRF